MVPGALRIVIPCFSQTNGHHRVYRFYRSAGTGLGLTDLDSWTAERIEGDPEESEPVERVIEWTPGRHPRKLEVWRHGKSSLAVAHRSAAVRSVRREPEFPSR